MGCITVLRRSALAGHTIPIERSACGVLVDPTISSADRAHHECRLGNVAVTSCMAMSLDGYHQTQPRGTINPIWCHLSGITVHVR